MTPVQLGPQSGRTPPAEAGHHPVSLSSGLFFSHLGQTQSECPPAGEAEAELFLALGALETGKGVVGTGLRGPPEEDLGCQEGGGGHSCEVGLAILLGWKCRRPSSKHCLGRNGEHSRSGVCSMVSQIGGKTETRTLRDKEMGGVDM